MSETPYRPLILASGSPRRQQLLREMGYKFQICVPDVDEHVEGHARDIVSALARRKAHAAAAHFDEGVVIASDTLVSLDGKPLGKPRDADDARAMLTALSGRQHSVFTGVCVLDIKTGKSQTRCVRTGVTFLPLDTRQIDDYIATGEPMDKAGAYAIQGRAGRFVESLDGELENVIGLPVVEVREMLTDFGL